MSESLRSVFCINWFDFERIIKDLLINLYRNAKLLYEIYQNNILTHAGMRPPDNLREILLGGLKEGGYADNALGLFMKEVWGVSLCVSMGSYCDADEKLIAQAVSAGFYEDLRVKVEKEFSIGKHVEMIYRLSERALEKLGVQPSTLPSERWELKAIYNYTYNFVEAVTSFLPHYNRYVFLVTALAQNYKEYLNRAAGGCREVFDIAEKLGAEEYNLADVKMYGYSDQHLVFLEPPKDAGSLQTPGGLLLGIVEASLDMWLSLSPRTRGRWFTVSTRKEIGEVPVTSPYHDYLNWVGESLNIPGLGRKYEAGVCASGQLKVEGKYLTAYACRERYPAKVYISKLAPYLLLRYVALRRVGEDTWEVKNRGGLIMSKL